MMENGKTAIPLPLPSNNYQEMEFIGPSVK